MIKLNGLLKKASRLPSSVLITGDDFRANESYKAIRTNILHLLNDSDNKSVLITSPYAGAGKTTTTSNLAITFAQLGKKVLIIDADMRKPSIHKLFSLPLSPGLSDILSGNKKGDFVHNTKFDNLHILCAGNPPDNPAELLSNEIFKNLLKENYENYDYIFVDAPPIDAVTDAVIISQLVCGTIIVIRQNHTEKDTLIRTVNRIKKVNATIVGYILNAIDYEKYSYKYGHYSGKYTKNYYNYYRSAVEKDNTTE